MLMGCGSGGGSDGSEETVQDIAQKFFDCCETGKGWDGCSQYVKSGTAPFNIQAVDALPGPNVTLNKYVKDYLDWMKGVVENMGEKATYEVKAQSYDSDTNTALYYAVFAGYSDYVYAINMDSEEKKVTGMTKIWNDEYAFRNTPQPPALSEQAAIEYATVERDVQVSAGSAQGFFDCCETGKGWSNCSMYVGDEQAPFSVQAVDALPGPPVSTIQHTKDYLDWMAGAAAANGYPSYTVKAQSFDSSTNTAMYYAVFLGSDYVYNIKMDPQDNKVIGLVKVWNDQYAFNSKPASEKLSVSVNV